MYDEEIDKVKNVPGHVNKICRDGIEDAIYMNIGRIMSGYCEIESQWAQRFFLCGVLHRRVNTSQVYR